MSFNHRHHRRLGLQVTRRYFQELGEEESAHHVDLATFQRASPTLRAIILNRAWIIALFCSADIHLFHQFW
jgi:hypothetical protein